MKTLPDNTENMAAVEKRRGEEKKKIFNSPRNVTRTSAREILAHGKLQPRHTHTHTHAGSPSPLRK